MLNMSAGLVRSSSYYKNVDISNWFVLNVRHFLVRDFELCQNLSLFRNSKADTAENCVGTFSFRDRQLSKI